MRINDRVKVDFVSESSTEFSGKRFIGEGVVDRVEDGRVFGRLDSGVPFVCGVSDAIVIEQQAIIINLKVQLNNMEACYIVRELRYGDKFLIESLKDGSYYIVNVDDVEVVK